MTIADRHQLTTDKPSLQLPSDRAAPPRITRPYLLVVPIPVYVDGEGRRWVDALWYKDLVLHLDYIRDLTIACPQVHAAPKPGARSLDGLSVGFVALPRPGGRLRNLLSAPKLVAALWRGIAAADVVHTGPGDWNPLSLGTLSSAIAQLQRKFRLVLVESSWWRLLPGQRAGLAERLGAAASEMVSQLCVSTADLAVFTQAEYQDTLLFHRERGHVLNASWVDEEDILSEAAAAEVWSRKANPERVRFLFAGRLARSKGVLDLLAAVRSLEGAGVEVAVDIMGDGELRAACLSAESTGPGVVVRVLDPVEYGPPFLEALRGYHALLVPNLGDEQPRIVFDAYSQAVPVLASATPGLKECVEEDVTGRFFPPGSPAELAHMIGWAAREVPTLMKLGMNGRRRAETVTHRQMHSRRHVIIDQALRASGRFPAEDLSGSPADRSPPTSLSQ
ncbi:MAG TPA: glycosyltransferase [Polyangia bacterium]